jgi:hypothetical protein
MPASGVTLMRAILSNTTVALLSDAPPTNRSARTDEALGSTATRATIESPSARTTWSTRRPARSPTPRLRVARRFAPTTVTCRFASARTQRTRIDAGDHGAGTQPRERHVHAELVVPAA